MQDILNSIKAYLYDRAVSPLIGAFIAAWLAWNYRFLVTLFSSDFKSPTDKFAAIDALFRPHIFMFGETSIQVSGRIMDGALFPAIIALAYLYAYPLIAKPVYEHSLRQQKILRSVKQALDDQRLLSAEESRELYRRLAQLQSKHQEEVDILNNQISALTQRNEGAPGNETKSSKLEPENPYSDKLESESEDLAELDEHIRNAVENKGSPASFFLNDLFGQKRWLEIPLGTRLKLEQRFRTQVERGDFVGVRLNGKINEKQQNYLKSGG